MPIMIKYYRVGQFSGPAPADREAFVKHILSGNAHEVDEDYKPLWGDAVYAFDHSTHNYKTIRDNWDSSD